MVIPGHSITGNPLRGTTTEAENTQETGTRKDRNAERQEAVDCLRALAPTRYFGASAGSFSIPGLILRFLRLLVPIGGKAYDQHLKELKQDLKCSPTNADVAAGRSPISTRFERPDQTMTATMLVVINESHRASIDAAAMHQKLFIHGAIPTALEPLINEAFNIDENGKLSLKEGFTPALETNKQNWLTAVTALDNEYEKDKKADAGKIKQLELQRQELETKIALKIQFANAVINEQHHLDDKAKAKTYSSYYKTVRSILKEDGTGSRNIIHALILKRPESEEEKNELWGKVAGYYTKPNSKTACPQLYRSLAQCVQAHHNHIHHEGSKPHPFATEAMTSFLAEKGLELLSDGRVRHLASGFAAEVNLSTDRTKLYLQFYGNADLCREEEDAPRKRTLAILGAHMLGRETMCYELAKDLAGACVEAAREMGLEKENIIINGHSMGGACATYAALTHGLTAYVTNPQPLPKVLQSKADGLSGRIADNAKRIIACNVEGDWLSGSQGFGKRLLRLLRRIGDLLGLGGAKVIGQRYEIPIGEHYGEGPEKRGVSRSRYAHCSVDVALEEYHQSLVDENHLESDSDLLPYHRARRHAASDVFADHGGRRRTISDPLPFRDYSGKRLARENPLPGHGGRHRAKSDPSSLNSSQSQET